MHTKRTTILLLAGAIVLPLVFLTILFYSSDAPSGSLIKYEEPTDDTTSIATREPANIRLIPREDFLKKFIPKSARLPRPNLNASLSGFLRANSMISLLPARNWEIQTIEVNATAALAIELPQQKILYSKNGFVKRPIASLTKLMTALVTYENLSLSDLVTISSYAVETPENFAHLVEGEVLTVEQLLYALLLESSNDAAVALEEFYNAGKSPEAGSFIYLMNEKATTLGLEETFFTEPTGLSAQNQSSAANVALLLTATFEVETLATILSTQRFITTSHNNEIAHSWVNVNALIKNHAEIIGGKTGYTEEAGHSMATIARAPNGNRLVIVVLNAGDREVETLKILEWVQEAYIWEK